ncbi:hypothetical protein [Desulfosediminicola ganghwensis]|uniref:hypothetical protein n=1 Tax=Desulfosediminicola ganghwensis TaxID=2569540 RepID=UPI0010AD26F6|nr:hypothetical protein [Desulfosediminicola ganghwensis]
MITAQQKEPEIGLIKANVPSIEGWDINWLISRGQIEYILHDIALLPADDKYPHLQRAQYQDDALLVISLEKYFHLGMLASSQPYKFVVTRAPGIDGKARRVILRTANPLRVRKLNFNASQATDTGLPKNSQDLLGAFALPDNQLVLIPDIAKIHDRLLVSQD